MNKLFLLVGFVGCVAFGFSQNIEDRLKELKDVTFEKVTTPKGYGAAYKVFIKQLVDHQDPSKGTFNQQIWLSHMSFEKQNVIVTQGYESSYNSITEPARLIGANQLDVEHRFFGNSIPKGMDYKFLTIEQATADLHHIREVFGAIYKKDWISTGISKGGETTVYYRYFFPNDVKVSVPYVAPLALSVEDPRIYHFFDTVNTSECRQAVLDFQKRILQKRKKVVKQLKKLNAKDSLRFTYLTFDQAFEYSILEYSFSFWQWNGECEGIPTSKTPLKQAVAHLNKVSSMAFFSDQEMKTLGSHYYQSGSQLGYYGYEMSDFKGLLPALSTMAGGSNPSAIFMPNKTPITFDGVLPSKVLKWATTEGHKIIYINGAGDPWASTAVPVSAGVDALWFNMKNKHHGQARYKNMTEQEKILFETTLEKWLMIDIVPEKN
jgi:hypothetical protein